MSEKINVIEPGIEEISIDAQGKVSISNQSFDNELKKKLDNNVTSKSSVDEVFGMVVYCNGGL